MALSAIAETRERLEGVAVEDRPIILVAPRLEVPSTSLEMPEQRSAEETIATNFMEAIEAAGGVPLMMPVTRDAALIERFIDMADGIAIPGGHDVDPAYWGVEGYDERLLCPERDVFEMALVKRAAERDVPLFATCRGMQLMNVAFGGTLDMDAPRRPMREGMAAWRHTGILRDPAHPVRVAGDSLLCRCFEGKTLVQANSAHHCCVDALGDGVRLVARATDGMPEAIEVPSMRFALGVQWHPEYCWRFLETDFLLWRAFVAAAEERKRAR